MNLIIYGNKYAYTNVQAETNMLAQFVMTKPLSE